MKSDLKRPFFQLEMGGPVRMIEMSRKHRSLPPRHKRLDRRGRLQAAIKWMTSYTGKNIARGYRKHFAVDSLCAVRELQLLGVPIDMAYEAAVLSKRGPDIRKKRTEKKKEEKFTVSEEDLYGFAFIAGYTAGGVPTALRKKRSH